MATPFGKAVRKYRIERDKKLKDMADALNVQSAYLSAVELGNKRITDKLLEDIVAYFDDSTIETELRSLVEQSQPDFTFVLRNKTDEERELVMAFARKFPGMSASERDHLRAVLEPSKENR